jgi:hypothetical protein
MHMPRRWRGCMRLSRLCVHWQVRPSASFQVSQIGQDEPSVERVGILRDGGKVSGGVHGDQRQLVVVHVHEGSPLGINDHLKNICQVEHSRHRSPANFLVNRLGGLIAYCHLPRKPSRGLGPLALPASVDSTGVRYARYDQEQVRRLLDHDEVVLRALGITPGDVVGGADDATPV